jgi:catechol 2,3-dioxygenase-like lactoylglutathione lyase family enzyme
MDLQITGMDHIVLNVADIDGSLGFYTDVIGLQAERVEQFHKGEVGFPSVRINESTLIDLVKSNAPVVNEGVAHNLNHFCLVADNVDLDSLVEMLKAQDVPVLRGPVSRWGARGQAMSVYFLDPDGNEIEVRCY